MAFATTTPWADHVAAGLLVNTKRVITQSPRDVSFCKASRDCKKDHRERRREACTVVGACVVVAVATEHGLVEQSSAGRPSLAKVLVWPLSIFPISLSSDCESPELI